MLKRCRQPSVYFLTAALFMASGCDALKSCRGENQSADMGEPQDIPRNLGHATKPMTSEESKAAIGERARVAIEAWKKQDAATLASVTHPTKGVRFSPYAFVDIKSDIVFKKDDMANFFTNDRAYIWGTMDGSGDPIQVTPREYYQRFIYSVDFANAEKVSFNTVLGTGNTIENMTEVYPDAAWVEYYFSGFKPEFAGMDWQSLRLVFEKDADQWFLVGVIHNQWTT